MLYLEIRMLMYQNAFLVLGRILVPGPLYALLTDMEGVGREHYLRYCSVQAFPCRWEYSPRSEVYRPLSVASNPLEASLAYLSRIHIGRGCDEPSTDCQLELKCSSCRARMVRDEIIGKLCLLPPLHELQVQPACWAPGHDCIRAWQYA